MNKEIQTELNENIIKEANIQKDENNTSFLPLNEKEKNDSNVNLNLKNLQNSACKNLKNDPKPESANIYL